ncbi:uncharacterized protein C12orf56 homolog isoform X2 [Petromyzon marinus]|uniref:uncharacterized protein C12orf56 homolog isoform X2 n=1 Tax=Petromyzon marinus TaxID=7757 RepID=UPI003F6E4C4A
MAAWASWGSPSAASTCRRNSKLESFLERSLRWGHCERVRAYEPCVVGRRYRFVVLTDSALLVMDNPPRSLGQLVELRDVTHVRLVNDFPEFLSGADRENAQHIVVTHRRADTGEPAGPRRHRSRRRPAQTTAGASGDEGRRSPDPSRTPPPVSPAHANGNLKTPSPAAAPGFRPLPKLPDSCVPSAGTAAWGCATARPTLDPPTARARSPSGRSPAQAAARESLDSSRDSRHRGDGSPVASTLRCGVKVREPRGRKDGGGGGGSGGEEGEEGGGSPADTVELHVYIVSSSSPFVLHLKSTLDNFLIRATLQFKPEFDVKCSARLLEQSTCRSAEEARMLFGRLSAALRHEEASPEETAASLRALCLGAHRCFTVKALFWRSESLFPFLASTVQRLVIAARSSPCAYRADHISLSVVVLKTLAAMFRETETVPWRTSTLLADGGQALSDLLAVLTSDLTTPLTPTDGEGPRLPSPSTPPPRCLQERRLVAAYTEAATALLYEVVVAARQAEWNSGAARPPLTIAWVVSTLEGLPATETFVAAAMSRATRALARPTNAAATPPESANPAGPGPSPTSGARVDPEPPDPPWPSLPSSSSAAAAVVGLSRRRDNPSPVWLRPKTSLLRRSMGALLRKWAPPKGDGIGAAGGPGRGRGEATRPSVPAPGEGLSPRQALLVLRLFRVVEALVRRSARWRERVARDHAQEFRFYLHPLAVEQRLPAELPIRSLVASAVRDVHSFLFPELA